MWDLIVSVPDHCLSFYFLYHTWCQTVSPRDGIFNLHLITIKDFNNLSPFRRRLKIMGLFQHHVRR